MVNGKYVLHGVIIILILFLLSQNYRGIRTTQQQEELLGAHLRRLITQNEKRETLVKSGARIIVSYQNYADKYLDNENNLRPEFTYVFINDRDIVYSLENEHKREQRLSECVRDIFSHTDMVFDYIMLIKKSIIDNRIYLGEYHTLHKSGKYEVYINNVNHPFSSEALYKVECLDTLNLQINMFAINNKTYGIDTTIFKERLIIGDL